MWHIIWTLSIKILNTVYHLLQIKSLKKYEQKFHNKIQTRYMFRTFSGCCSNWWPLFVIVCYLLSPVPYVVAKRYHDAVESSNALVEVCVFLTTCIVVSAYGIPIVLAHSHSIVSILQLNSTLDTTLCSSSATGPFLQVYICNKYSYIL